MPEGGRRLTGGRGQLSTIHTSSGTDVILEGLGLQDSCLFKGFNREGLAQVRAPPCGPTCHTSCGRPFTRPGFSFTVERWADEAAGWAQVTEAVAHAARVFAPSAAEARLARKLQKDEGRLRNADTHAVFCGDFNFKPTSRECAAGPACPACSALRTRFFMLT